MCVTIPLIGNVGTDCSGQVEATQAAQNVAEAQAQATVQLAELQAQQAATQGANFTNDLKIIIPVIMVLVIIFLIFKTKTKGA